MHGNDFINEFKICMYVCVGTMWKKTIQSMEIKTIGEITMVDSLISK